MSTHFYEEPDIEILDECLEGDTRLICVAFLLTPQGKETKWQHDNIHEFTCAEHEETINIFA